MTAEEYALRILTSSGLKSEVPSDKSHESPQQKETAVADDHSLPRCFCQAAITPGKTSIIMLTHNHLEQTKKCLKNIRKYTPEPYEIIFVDNTSIDGAGKWLQAEVKENKNYSLAETRDEGGFAARLNQGIFLARGEYVLVLADDVLVGPEWLEGMLDCLNRAPKAGIVGPMTNRGRGPQQIADENYRTVDYLEKYAVTFRDRYRARRIPLRNLDDFCLLFRRTLVEKMGLFDERFVSADLGVEDFCLRTALEGSQNYIAGDVFVHHFGSQAAKTGSADHRSDLGGNRKALEQKWTFSVQNPLGKKLAVLRATEVSKDLYHRGLVDKAVEVLIDCIKITPEAEEIYYELARIFIEMKRFSEALEVVDSMPEAVRDNLKGMEYSGYAREGLGLDEEAAAYTDKMLALDEKCPEALNLKGILTYKKGDAEAAANFFTEAMISDPGYGEAYINMGVVKWAIEEKDAALAYFQKGFIHAPTIPDHSSLYYSAASSLGRYHEAELYFHEAAEVVRK